MKLEPFFLKHLSCKSKWLKESYNSTLENIAFPLFSNFFSGCLLLVDAMC